MRRWLHTLMTSGATPRGIAGGVSLGLSLSLIPIPTVGMALALAVAPRLRCNLPATYLGTALVNPVTGPLIYFAELWIGLQLLGRPLPSWAQMQGLDAWGWWHTFIDALGPFVFGALICSIAGVVITFPLVWWLSSRWIERSTDITQAAPSNPPEASHACPPPTDSTR